LLDPEAGKAGAPPRRNPRRFAVERARASLFSGLILALSILGVFGLQVETARAEGFIDLRIGGHATPDSDGTVKFGPADGLPLLVASGSVDIEAEATLGLRGGYWLESSPYLGFALDVSYYDPREDTEDGLEFEIVPISALLMLRFPLMKNSDHPRGRLQPYVGVGPGLFVTEAELELTSIGAPSDFEDIEVDVGVDVRAGAVFHFFRPATEMIVESLGLFVEYRFTYFEPSDFKDRVGGVPIEIEIDELSTHHAVAGIGLYF
jgi:hypothetical protein